MDLRTQQRAGILLLRMSGNREKKIECTPYHPQKISFNSVEESENYFEYSTPEENGIDSELINEFITELMSREEMNIHSLTIIRNSKIIAELYPHPFEKGVWHVTHSLAKSITGLGIGILIDEGRLSVDDKVVDFFPAEAGKINTLFKKDLLVKHLLTMSSGISLNEVGSLTENDWLHAYLNSGLDFKPGEKFMYNSMNTYMLCAIAAKITGKSFFEFLKERLFAPMGINKIHWESCPKGITKGGWGMYITPEDIAKIGQLVINKGMWNGERLISEKWIEEATSYQISSNKQMNDYGYGYQIWMGKRRGSVQFNGMLGQNAFIFPDINMEIIITAGNGELAPKSNASMIVESYFGDGFRPKEKLPQNRAALKMLENTIKNYAQPRLSAAKSLPSECSEISGSVYKVDGKCAVMLPICIQGIQNNFPSGMETIGFRTEGDCFYIDIEENGEKYSIPVGFADYIKSEIDVKGEPYIIKTKGVFKTDEDDNTVLKINMPFIETSSARNLKIFFLKDKLRLKFSETPGLDMAVEGISTVTQGENNSILFNLAGKATNIDKDYFDFKVEKTLAPTVTAVKIK